MFSGCKVMIASRNEEKLQLATKELAQIGEVDLVRCNIREEEDVRYKLYKIWDIINGYIWVFCHAGTQYRLRYRNLADLITS